MVGNNIHMLPSVPYSAKFLYSKPTLEGRLQRQIALYEQGIDMKDPMEFFEEITRPQIAARSVPDGTGLYRRRIGYC